MMRILKEFFLDKKELEKIGWQLCSCVSLVPFCSLNLKYLKERIYQRPEWTLLPSPSFLLL